MAGPRPHALFTQRLVLEPIASSDAQRFFELSNHPAVVDGLWHGIPVPQHRAEKYVEESDRTFASRGFGLWSITDHRSLTIGFAGLRLAGRTERIELSYALHPAHWGNGLAREAVERILHHSFVDLQLNTIEASTHPGNDRSLALLGRVGMRVRHVEESAHGRLIVHSLDASTYVARNGDAPDA